MTQDHKDIPPTAMDAPNDNEGPPRTPPKTTQNHWNPPKDLKDPPRTTMDPPRTLRTPPGP